MSVSYFTAAAAATLTSRSATGEFTKLSWLLRAHRHVPKAIKENVPRAMAGIKAVFDTAQA
eukprot:CAMPEP_0181466904 /NCGR_PEP_ID=MMETSP1110-20121109/36699_1 /TAXON_ID=174948 /ORGANISM="Symbiodinium sp., Strain CCMP421" /LENGTH=60 /DNA_ID=CAMNT_0023591705 /DNA_START=29 /DNA_END=211 /DNA_ORIENTATION=-